MFNQLRKLRFRRRNERISPLNDKDVNTLRSPGQSIQYMLDDEITNMILYVLAISVCLNAVIQTWIAYFYPSNLQSQAWMMTAVMIALLVLLIPSGIFKYRYTKRLREAYNGERIVAEHLNQLIADGYTVFHDVPCDFKKGKKMLFNIDHLLVGKKGIFVVETKTLRKMKQGSKVHYKLRYDGQKVSFLSGASLDQPDPINQAKKQVDWLKRELVQTTNKQFDVTPVVTFPGWYVEITARANHVIVLGTPKVEVFRSILAKREEKLTDEDVALVKHRIKMHIQDHRP